MVRVVEGGDATGQNSTAIGTCVIRDLPPDLPAGTPVKVAFQYEENGRIVVKARLPLVDKTTTLTLERASGLGEKALEDWSDRLKQIEAKRGGG